MNNGERMDAELFVESAMINSSENVFDEFFYSNSGNVILVEMSEKDSIRRKGIIFDRVK